MVRTELPPRPVETRELVPETTIPPAPRGRMNRKLTIGLALALVAGGIGGGLVLYLNADDAPVAPAETVYRADWKAEDLGTAPADAGSSTGDWKDAYASTTTEYTGDWKDGIG